jgi:hypothetical protein
MAEIVAGSHFYDPPRNTYHEFYRDVSTDPLGENWLKNVYSRSYGPLMRSGVLSSMSYDINQVLLHEMKRHGLPSQDFIRGKKDNVIGTSYIHPILPDLTDDDKRIVIGAGLDSYRNDFGRSAKIFWSPESALDDATCKVLLEFGIEAVICAPWQLVTADGQPADNRPMRVSLSGRNSIIAIPYDRDVSRILAFKLKSSSYAFRDNVIRPKLGDSDFLIWWVDGETFGHHEPFADMFLHHLLLHALPESGIKTTPINQIDFKKLNLPNARLVERSAWSCHCGNLARWNGSCGCDRGNNLDWISPYYQTFAWLNQAVTQIIHMNLGKDWRTISRKFEKAFINPGGRFTNTTLSLIAAKVDALTARTSCGTFFGDPDVAGRINIIFALEACQHLRDAGMSAQADYLEGQLMDRLKMIADPKNYTQSLSDVTHAMLGLAAQNRTFSVAS